MRFLRKYYEHGFVLLLLLLYLLRVSVAATVGRPPYIYCELLLLLLLLYADPLDLLRITVAAATTICRPLRFTANYCCCYCMPTQLQMYAVSLVKVLTNTRFLLQSLSTSK